MLEAKYKIGDQVFDKFNPQAKGRDAWMYTDTIIGVHYVLNYNLPFSDGNPLTDGGFEYTLVNYDDRAYTKSEYLLGKRRKQ